MNEKYYLLGIILGKDNVKMSDNHISFILGYRYLPIVKYIENVVQNIQVVNLPNTNEVNFDIDDETKQLLDNIENDINTLSNDELMSFILGLVDISGKIQTLQENKRHLIDIYCSNENILYILQDILFNKYQIESILKKYKTKKGDYWELSIVSNETIKLSKLLEPYYQELDKLTKFRKHIKLSIISNFNYTNPKKGQHLTEEQISLIYKLHEEGKSLREIAKIVKCSHSSVDYWVKQMKKERGGKNE